MTTETASHQREAAFHDAWATSTSLGDVLVRGCFEAPTALENQFILSQMGPLAGKKLLGYRRRARRVLGLLCAAGRE